MRSENLRAFIKGCPQTPGVYLIKNKSGKPVYIGKARSLRSRLTTHFGPAYHPDYKERMIRKEAAKIGIIQTATEAEALLLEASLIKEHRPKYNKELKDDKSYPFLKITDEKFPRLLVVRGRKSDGSIYFGPYTNAGLLREAVSLLRRLFPMRTCTPMPDKVCLMFHIGQCRGPCVGHMSEKEYAQMVKELVYFLEGKRDALVRTLSRRMKEASRDRHYELARTYRDQMRALAAVAVKQAPSQDEGTVLLQMQRVLKLSRYPARIEAFDISNISGKNPVGSMVVFDNGKPKRSEYRKFKIKTVAGVNDYDMMREVVRRRYERLLNEKKPLPDLVLIDGGRGHLSSAKEELDRVNLSDLDLVSIAKQHEYLYKMARPNPYVLPQDSPVLQLLRHVRDEAHRFAISFYRKLHRKEMVWSELDAVGGVGPTRKKKLILAFKTISAVKAASRQDLAEIEGIDEKTAKNIELYFKRG